MSDLNNTVCRCIGDTFSSSFYVPPNVINFLTVWGKFDASNASVYGTLIGVFFIYVVLVILLRKQDRKDSEKVMYVKHFDLQIMNLAILKMMTCFTDAETYNEHHIRDTIHIYSF